MKNPLRSCLLAASLLASAPVATAALTASGDFATGVTAPTLSITAPVSFVATTSGNLSIIVLPNWVTYDGGPTFVAFQPGSQLSFQINGGTTSTVPLAYLSDNRSNNVGDLPVGSGSMSLSVSIGVSAGQTITILPGTWTVASDAGFSAPPASYDTDNLFLTTNLGVRGTTNGSTIPEPSTAIAGLAGAVLLLRRRK